MKTIPSVISVVVLLLAQAAFAANEDLERLAHGRTYWPTDNWKTAPRDAARYNSPACQEFRYVLQDEDGVTNKRKEAKKPEDEPLRTDGLVVIHHGKIEYEWYDGQYSAIRPHCMWSASKSASSAILGAAVQEGKLTLDDHLASFFPDLRRADGPNEHFFNDVRMRDLLGMNAGFDWNESYGGDPKDSQVVPFLYQEGYRDSATWAMQRPFYPDAPGTRFTYSSGNVSIMQGVLKQIYGEDYDSMPWRTLFNRIGMQNMVLERDQVGTFMGSSYIWASVRDMAKLGYLYMNNGWWEDLEHAGQQPPVLTRVIPEEFVTMTRVLTPGEDQPSVTNKYIIDEGTYGGGAWWVNLPVPLHGIDRLYPKAPHDMFFAAGHYGQIILLMPSQDLIVARTGHDTEYDSKINHIAELAVACFAK